MIFWGLLLHFYQPPTQYPWVLEKVTQECYRPLVSLFKAHPHVRITVNINGVLLDMLQHQGGADVVAGFKSLVDSGQWEITGTAKYHAILPLLPDLEAQRQIQLQRRSLSDHLGVRKLRGFFPPELCFSADLCSKIREAGFEWVLASGTSIQGPWPMDFVPRHRLSGLEILFRDEIISNRISFERISAIEFLKLIEHIPIPGGKEGYVITAMDAETYGHHIPHWESHFLGKAYELLAKETHGSKVKTAALSEITERFSSSREVVPKPSSWSTTQEDKKKGIFYPLWNHPSNPIHDLQWRHIRLCLEQLELSQSCAHLSGESKQLSDNARLVMDAALHSCQFWWASRKTAAGSDLVAKGLWLQEESLMHATGAVFAVHGMDPLKNQAEKRFNEASEISTQIRRLLSTSREARLPDVVPASPAGGEAP